MSLLTHCINKYNQRSFLTIGLFLLLLQLTDAQENSFVISGEIVDSISLQPIKNTHISSPTSSIGVVSNSKGSFEMRVKSFPIKLEFSSIGYERKSVLISSKNDININVYLVPKTYELQEVQINEDANTYNPGIYKYSVLDYDFIGDSILLLQKKRSIGGTASLVLLNRKYDTLCYQKNLPKGITKIYKDCLNSYHLISSDSAYQIAFVENNIALFKPFEINWFNQVMGDCVFKKDGDLFFEFPIYQGFGHEIIYINEENKTKALFVKYLDKNAFTNLAEDISEISSFYYLHHTINATTNDSATVKHIHNFNQESRYIKEIAGKPIKNVICLNKDTIHYFNYYESKIQSFSQIDKSPTEVEINHKTQSGWGTDLLIDLVENKIYSVVKDKSDYLVYALNLKRGITTYITKISLFEGQHLKINGGYLYYLKNPSTNAYQVRKLSRIEL